jgi:hypothetical protein
VENHTYAVIQFADKVHHRGLADDVNGVSADDVRRWLTSLQGNVAQSTEYRNYTSPLGARVKDVAPTARFSTRRRSSPPGGDTSLSKMATRLGTGSSWRTRS